MNTTNQTTDRREPRKHPMWSQRDWNYLRAKGYTRDEILAIWDRDRAMGKGPEKHLISAKYACLD